MSVALDILASRKDIFWRKFVLLKQKKHFKDTEYQAAYLKGLQEGYGEGLVDGVDLGMDVGAGLTTGNIPVSKLS